MTEPTKPIEETDEYAAAADDEGPLPADMFNPPPPDSARPVVAARAAQEYAAAVHQTEQFVAQLDAAPGDDEKAEYVALVANEKAARARRRDALAAVGLTAETIEPEG